MTKRAQLSNLQECFVNFETEKLEGCSVVYLNETLTNGKSSNAILDAYSYVVMSDSIPSRGQSAVKTFMAERYGGDGILTNGGGARCGFDGVWQLKGLGPNQLAGKDVDAGHGDGNLSLNAAIYESIWSEIINVALPYGAIRTVAILDTGRTYEVNERSTPRGLLIRQPVVRPAHFIRAIYFKEQHLGRLSEDSQRVQSAIRKLVNFLPDTGNPTRNTNLSTCLKKGLFELAARFAEQFAAAKAKNIIHYNVSASNLSLNGAWLDLSGTRLFTELIGIDQVDINRFNTEYSPAIKSLQSMCYYLSKYSVIPIEESTHILEETTKHFEKKYDEQLSLYQVSQAGFPLWILRMILGSTEYIEFASNLRRLYTLNDFSVKSIAFDKGWNGYERWTARLFRNLLSSQVTDAATDLSWLNTGKKTTNLLLSSYNRLFSLAANVAAEKHINPHNFYRCIWINTTRLNRTHHILHNLEIEIKRIRESKSKNETVTYQALTHEAMLAATLSMNNEQGRHVLFWLSNSLTIWFDPAIGAFTLQATDSRTLSLDALFELREREADVNTALNFYGTLWTDLNEKSI